MGRYCLLIVSILFMSACGPGDEQSAEAATPPDLAGGRSAGPSGAALTAGTAHYHIGLKAWIPQYWVVDPSVLGVPIPYPNSLVIPNFSNCWDPGWLIPITVVYSRFIGDNHVGYDGSYRSFSTADFDWDGSSISNFSSTLYVGMSHRDLLYAWPGGLWWSGGTHECTEARAGNLYNYGSSGSGKDFTFTTTAADPFLPPGMGIGDPLFGRLSGSFSGGNLKLSWSTGQYPSFGLRVEASGQSTFNRTVMDASGLGSDTSSPTLIPTIAYQLNCYHPPLYCNTGSVTIPGPSSCAHPICSQGVPLTSSCTSCAATVCSRDPYCCQNWWDSICVSEVPSFCGLSC